MHDFLWSLEIAVLGMGTVFVMLIALMFALIGLNKSDRFGPKAEPVAKSPDLPGEQSVVVFRDPSGLSEDEIAAISVAVLTHAEVRRKQAAPVHRVHQPGSRLWASRWVAFGRTNQMQRPQRKPR